MADRKKRGSQRKAGKWRMLAAGFLLSAAFCLPASGMVRASAAGQTSLESDSNAESPASPESDSNALLRAMARLPASKDFWSGWTGDLGFLDGTHGNGTQEKPYQLSTKEHLMGLSLLAAGGMEIREGEGANPGDYSGAWFELERDIDLGGIQWIPIGFYESEEALRADKVSVFDGHFDGNGHTISNFRMYRPEWSNVGLFGALQNAVVENLTVQPGNLLTAKDRAGLLAGSAEHSEIRNVTVRGTLQASGTAGGLIGALSEESVVENCTADHAAVDGGKGKEIFIGGIAGTAANSLILDCTVNTGDSLSARIQGGGYVGGIVGFQNGTDIYNVHVMGTIGGSGSQSIGGVTGKYASGKLKVARFEGEIASSGLGSAAREGCFIGTRDAGFHFRYGTSEGADLAYLFADQEEKIAAGICGSGISDDNQYTYDAHIGFWNSRDNYFSLVQGRSRRDVEDRYFYEELENGMLHVIDTEEAAREFPCAPDHFAPNALGRPVRGYLVSVLQIDTAANVQNYYDVAVLTARGESVYCREMDKDRRGAVAPGDVITVATAPKNTKEEKYQMEGVPTYTDEMGNRVDMTYQTGGTYSFVMPEHDTEISAVYRKVAANVRIQPEEYEFHVVQERTGDRKNPSAVTEVKDSAGRLIARYINGELEEGTQVQDVMLEAVVDRENDVADEAVRWSIDDGDLIRLKKNADEDASGYTKQSASLELNLNADFFNRIINKAEKNQADMQYRYPIPDTVYGDGTLGGVAVLTASTRPSASFEGKPVTANCRISVTFQIKDRTRVAVEDVSLDQDSLSFTVTRRLTGDRKNPSEQLIVTEPAALTASFTPDYFDKKEISWSVDDENIVTVEAGAYGAQDGEQDYKNAAVRARTDTKWIRDIIEAEDASFKEDPYKKRGASGEREALLTVTAEDTLGNRRTASCGITVTFQTEDQTEILPERVELDQESLDFNLIEVKEGGPTSKTTGRRGFEPRTLTARIFPQPGDGEEYKPYDQGVIWESSDPSVTVEEGVITPLPDAKWIQEAGKEAPYHGEKEVIITARAAGNREVSAACRVTLTYDLECLVLDKKELVFDMTLTKTGSRSNPVLTWKGAQAQTVKASAYPQRRYQEAEGEPLISWKLDPALLRLEGDGTVVPITDSAWIAEAMKTYPYTAEKKTAITVAAGEQQETVEVTLKFKMENKTTSGGSASSSSSSGGSSGSGGSGSSSGITVNGTTKTAIPAPEGSVTGVWVQDGAGRWLFTSEGRTFAGEWAYIHNPYAGEGQETTSWFWFDENGYMKTGWFQDPADGSWYFLHDQSDGSLGHMCTGWRQIQGSWYYFGTDGRMAVGWHWIDGKCYYMNRPEGTMAADTTTPDGYTVNSSGEWTVNGVVQTRETK